MRPLFHHFNINFLNVDFLIEIWWKLRCLPKLLVYCRSHLSGFCLQKLINTFMYNMLEYLETPFWQSKNGSTVSTGDNTSGLGESLGPIRRIFRGSSVAFDSAFWLQLVQNTDLVVE